MVITFIKSLLIFWLHLRNVFLTLLSFLRIIYYTNSNGCGGRKDPPSWCFCSSFIYIIKAIELLYLTFYSPLNVFSSLIIIRLNALTLLIKLIFSIFHLLINIANALSGKLRFLNTVPHLLAILKINACLVFDLLLIAS